MILADTSVVIDFLRAPSPRYLKIIKDNEASFCGVTLAEIYAGARSAADFNKYDKALSLFRLIPIPKKIWPSLGRNLSALTAKGVTVPLADVLIATVAIENDLEVWNHDAHFPTMQKVLRKLKLFKEPP